MKKLKKLLLVLSSTLALSSYAVGPGSVTPQRDRAVMKRIVSEVVQEHEESISALKRELERKHGVKCSGEAVYSGNGQVFNYITIKSVIDCGPRNIYIYINKNAKNWELSRLIIES